jgi:hypothetical protein
MLVHLTAAQRQLALSTLIEVSQSRQKEAQQQIYMENSKK